MSAKKNTNNKNVDDCDCEADFDSVSDALDESEIDLLVVRVKTDCVLSADGERLFVSCRLCVGFFDGVATDDADALAECVSLAE